LTLYRNEETSATITGDQPGNYLINLNVWKRGSWDPAFQADSWHTLKLTDENPEDTCNNIGGYWSSSTSACFIIPDSDIVIGEEQLLALEQTITNVTPTAKPTCSWTLGTLSGDAGGGYNPNLTNSGNFTAPWATGTAKVSCPSLSLDGVVTIGMGDYTLVSDFTNSLPATKTSADAALGSKTATTTSPVPNFAAYTLDSTGLKITPGDGNYLAYDAYENFPSTGSMEIHINKSELSSAGFGYLFEAEDSDGKKVEVYKDSNSQLWLKVGGSSGKFFTTSELTSALSNLSDSIVVKIEWPTLKLSLMNEDGAGEVVASRGGGTPPAFNFGSETKMYIGSKIGGATKGEEPNPNLNAQYQGYIKMIRISR
jgi:hypothetical protein